MSEIDADDDVTLTDLLEMARESWHAELHTALPGRVVSYDVDTQRADVRPVVQRTVPRVDGGTALEDLPTIRSVPVLWPGGGGFCFHAPLAAGDDVMLLVPEQDPQQFLETGQASAPLDHRRHHLAGAFALPLIRSRARRIEGASASELVIGHDDGSGPAIRVTASAIKVGRNATAKAVRADNLGTHLAAIADDLDTIATAASVTATSYGSIAKAALDLASPIAATVAEVE